MMNAQLSKHTFKGCATLTHRSAREVYNQLPAVETDFQLKMTCDGNENTYTLSTSVENWVQITIAGPENHILPPWGHVISIHIGNWYMFSPR